MELRSVVFGIYDAMNADRGALPSELSYHFDRWNGVWAGRMSGFLAERNASLLNRYKKIAAVVSNRTRLKFGDAWRLYPDRCYFRRNIGTNSPAKVAWHIDADAARLHRKHSLNVWLPLDAVGVDLPSLDVIPKSHAVMRAVPLLTDGDRCRDDTFASEIGAAITPKLVPGDALAFDQFTLHRTQCVGSENSIRTACEFRFQRGFTALISIAQSTVAMARRLRACGASADQRQ